MIGISGDSVLLLSPFFYPEKISTGKYNTYLAEELVAQGMRVTVITSHPLYPNWRPEKSDVTLSGMNIRRGGAWLRYPKSALLRRAILESWYAWYAVKNYFILKSKTTHVVAVCPPSLFFLLLAPLLPKSCRKIGIIHDLQGVYASKSKGLISRIVHSTIHYVERRCFQACDRLIFLSASMANRAISEYGLDEKKCTVCYPFVALPAKQISAGSALAHLFDSNKINVVYSGALGDKQNPDGLFAFFGKLVIVRPDISCHIFSAGPHYDRLRNSCAVLVGGQSAVLFHDLVEPENLDELYARSDAQVIPQVSGTGDGSLPSKLPNLMTAGVPVFVICDKDSELADLVEEAGAGVVSNTWNADELVNEFIRFLPTLNDETRTARQARLHHFVEEKFSIRRVIEEITKA